ncbi:hypothetical protein GCM10023321_32780 [Pseudonocardia eucalypti]|uniref:Uncharacterized protein n=1 Tax=Pseudonocardia eucalypti TaxID=648755 RepID=A0ABP9Q4C5_9PSEU
MPRTGLVIPAPAPSAPPASATPASITGLASRNRRGIGVPPNISASTGKTITWTFTSTVAMPAPTSKIATVHIRKSSPSSTPDASPTHTVRASSRPRRYSS